MLEAYRLFLSREMFADVQRAQGVLHVRAGLTKAILLYIGEQRLPVSVCVHVSTGLGVLVGQVLGDHVVETQM